MEREHEHSPDQRLQEPNNDLERLYRSWGVFDLLQRTIDQLPPNWLRILNIARNLLEGEPIPGVEASNTLRALTERSVRIDREKRLVTRKWQEPTEIPSSDIDIRPIRTLSELPMILSSSLLLADAAPDLFTYRAVSGNLPVAEPQKPGVAMEERSEILEYLEEVKRPGRSMRQKVYTLLDVSLSMRDSFKLFFAKAVVMAYLTKAYEEEAQIFFRVFAGEPGDRIDCTAEEQFARLAQYVLKTEALLGTNIALALKTAVADIGEIDRPQGDEAATCEILLITDGGTHYDIPAMPKNITLHTLLLSDGTETVYDYQGEYIDGAGVRRTVNYNTRSRYQARLEALKHASRTFTEIDPSHIKLPAPDAEAWLLQEEAARLEKELSAGDHEDITPDENLGEQIKKERQMATAYRKMYPKNKGLKKTEKRAKSMENKINPKGLKKEMLKAVEKALKKVRALSRRKLNMKKMFVKVPRQSQRLSGTLYDFRIGRDKTP